MLWHITPLYQGLVSSTEWEWINASFYESSGDLQWLLVLTVKGPFWLITLVRWKASFDKAQMSIAAWFIREDLAIRWDLCLFLQHVSLLSSEYIRGVWATESSDTRRWIEVVMNLVSNSNSWMAIDKTNKERELLAEGDMEMRATLLRTFYR